VHFGQLWTNVVDPGIRSRCQLGSSFFLDLRINVPRLSSYAEIQIKSLLAFVRTRKRELSMSSCRSGQRPFDFRTRASSNPLQRRSAS
jgi:hypothetical protein